MQKLISELTRLYLQPGAIPADALGLTTDDGRTRAIAIHFNPVAGAEAGQHWTRLCAVATHLFARHGYGPVSVNQVCALSAVSKGAFYHHYASKDALLFGIYEPLLALQLQHLRDIVLRPEPASERLRHIAVDVVLTSIEHLDALTVFQQSMHLLDPVTQRRVRPSESLPPS